MGVSHSAVTRGMMSHRRTGERMSNGKMINKAY